MVDELPSSRKPTPLGRNGSSTSVARAYTPQHARRGDTPRNAQALYLFASSMLEDHLLPALLGGGLLVLAAPPLRRRALAALADALADARLAPRPQDAPACDRVLRKVAALPVELFQEAEALSDGEMAAKLEQAGFVRSADRCAFLTLAPVEVRMISAASTDVTCSLDARRARGGAYGRSCLVVSCEDAFLLQSPSRNHINQAPTRRRRTARASSPPTRTRSAPAPCASRPLRPATPASAWTPAATCSTPTASTGGSVLVLPRRVCPRAPSARRRSEGVGG